MIAPSHIKVTHPRAQRVKRQALASVRKVEKETRQQAHLDRLTEEAARLHVFRTHVLFWLPNLVTDSHVEYIIKRHMKMQEYAQKRIEDQAKICEKLARIPDQDVACRRACKVSERLRIRAAGRVMKCVDEIRFTRKAPAPVPRALPPLPY